MNFQTHDVWLVQTFLSDNKRSVSHLLGRDIEVVGLLRFAQHAFIQPDAAERCGTRT